MADITIKRNKQYRMKNLVFRGLEAQMPKGSGLGGPWEPDPDNYSVLDGEIVYRLHEEGADAEAACQAVYGKTLAEMSEDLWELEPKIWAITDPLIREAREDHRTIDYRTALTIPLFPKRTTLKGEVQRVDWYADAELTNLILSAEMTYKRDAYGFAKGRVTTRKWVMNNGEYHPLTKVTEKCYEINREDQIKEGKRRRENIVDTVQMPVLGAMQAVLMPMGHPVQEILLLARKVMDHLDPYFKTFIQNSSTVTDLSDPNVGRKTIVVEFERMATNEYPWMKNPVELLGGASIEQYLVNEFSI